MKLISAFIVSVVMAIAGVFFFRLDTYTAVVETPPFLDTYKGQAMKFVRVIPNEGKWLSGVDRRGVLKLIVSDTYIPYFAWATDGDRFEGLKKGDVICVTDTGYRLDFLSKYPIFVKYTEGVCLN